MPDKKAWLQGYKGCGRQATKVAIHKNNYKNYFSLFGSTSYRFNNIIAKTFNFFYKNN